MTLSEMVAECLKDSKDWFGKEEDLIHHALSLCGEAGEVANLVKKIDRGDHHLSELKGQIAEEVIDTFIYVMNIAGILGLDLEDGYKRKRSYNAVRFTNGRNHHG